MYLVVAADFKGWFASGGLA